MEFVTWDDDIPNMLGKVIKFVFQTTNQDILYIYYNISTRIYIYYIIIYHYIPRMVGHKFPTVSDHPIAI